MNFQDPFDALSNVDRCHTSIDIPKRFQAYLNSLHPMRGTLQTTVAILLVKLEKLLKEQGLTEYDPENYERVVNESQLVVWRDPQYGHVTTAYLGGVAGANTPSETPSRDDNGGTTATPPNTPQLPTESSSPPVGNSRKATKKGKRSQTQG